MARFTVMLNDLPFGEVWAVDFEFKADAGERPVVHCMCALEVRTGREIRLWADELQRRKAAPFPTSPEVLFVAFYCPAEFSCFLALDWPLPERILDLYAEFRVATNGLELPCGRGLLGGPEMGTSLPAGYASWSDVPDALVPVQKVTGKRLQSSLPAFVKGPLSLGWLSAIAETGSPPAIWVALALKVQVDRRREEWVSPPFGILAKFGVKRSSLSRAIQALEVAGVIEVQRRKGRPPLVSLCKWKDGVDG